MSSYSVLVVDDEPDNFDVIEALLTSETYQLHYANCGRDAIEALDKFNPDLILLDVMMPDLDGIEVCQRIKLMSKWQGVPIIMVTALSGKEDLARCLAAGADDFIDKPIHSIELLARVNSMLRIKRQHDRIKSFSKLQRNIIHTVSNNLNEIKLDLAVGFPNEFNSPLISIANNIEYLKQNIKQLSLAETLHLLDASDQSVSELHTLTQKFWFYLKLVADTPTPSNQDRSAPSEIIKQILGARFARELVPANLICEVENITLAMNTDLAEWLFTELIDYLLDRDRSDTYLKVNGQSIDNAFHLSLSSLKINDPSESNSEISKLIQFNSTSDENSELPIGLKIVKKIVEIYDGVFLISGIDQAEMSIYVNLPLIADVKALTESATLSGQN